MSPPTMPDPLHLLPDDPGDVPAEIPIREVISRLTVAAGGPLADYVTSHAHGDLSAPARSLLLKALDAASLAMDELLDTWDALHPERPFPELDTPAIRAEVAGAPALRLAPAPATDPATPRPGMLIIGRRGRGRIIETTHGFPGSTRYRVRWEDGRSPTVTWEGADELKPAT